MLTDKQLFKMRDTASTLYPEPHERLRVASELADSMAKMTIDLGRTIEDIDLELMTRVVDMAESTLSTILNSKEKGNADIPFAQNVIHVSRQMRLVANVKHPHLAMLTSRSDALSAAISRGHGIAS